MSKCVIYNLYRRVNILNYGQKYNMTCIDLHAYSSLAITAVGYILLVLLYVLVFDKSARGDSIKTSFR